MSTDTFLVVKNTVCARQTEKKAPYPEEKMLLQGQRDLLPSERRLMLLTAVIELTCLQFTRGLCGHMKTNKVRDTRSNLSEILLN